MVYVECLKKCIPAGEFPYDRSCRQMCGSAEACRRMKRLLGIETLVQRTCRGRVRYFDIDANTRQRAVEQGAKEVNHRTMVKLFRGLDVTEKET